MEFFEVGGCVRDEIMGVPSKDIDFTVVIHDTDDHEGWLLRPGQGSSLLTPFEAMEWQLKRDGFKIFQSKPEFFTIRAMFPKGHKHSGVADFVLARKDGTSTDGRRPDFVEPGTLLDDLARRDFTMNAIAKDIDGNLIDPFDGQRDIRFQTILCVGSARERMTEDPLRALRALRFSVTKQFRIHESIVKVVNTKVFAESLNTVSKERQREEMEKMFAFRTIRSMEILERFPHIRSAVFSDGLRLSATMKA
jgi:tRNA nucleotidyltransferase/poly(A) polymerase